jgi:tetratricopeptide (TPR) repeat protein
MKLRKNGRGLIPTTVIYTPMALLLKWMRIGVSLVLALCALVAIAAIAFFSWRTLTLYQLYQQMQSALSRQEWSEVRRVGAKIDALDTDYRDTRSIYLESLYQETLQLIQKKDYVNAQQTSEILYALDKNYKDAGGLQCKTWYLDEYDTILANNYDQARSKVVQFAEQHSDCPDVVKLYIGSYRQQINGLIQAEAFDDLITVVTEFNKLPYPMNSWPGYKEDTYYVKDQIHNSYETSLNEEQWEKARDWASVIGKLESDQVIETSLLLETYYRPAIALKADKKWEEAAIALDQVFNLDPNYKDTRKSLLFVYMTLADKEESAGHLEAQLKWLESAVAIDPTYEQCSQQVFNVKRLLNLKAWLKTGMQPDYLHLSNHSNSVRDIEFTPDGKFLLSASIDNTIGVWDTASWTLKNTLRGHTDPVYALAVSPDSQMVVTASLDGSGILWGLKSGRITRLTGHTREVISAAFSPDGKLIATGSMDKKIILYDINGKQLGQLTGHNGDIYSLAFSPDGRYLASTGEDRTVMLWNVSSKSLYKTYKIGFTSKHLRFSQQGDYLAVLENKAAVIHVIDMKLGKMNDIKLSFEPTDIAWMPDQHYMIPVGSSIVWVSLDGTVAKEYRVSSGVASIDVSPDASTIALGLSSGSIEIITVNLK